MKISVRSTRPTVERSSCRCVPSPQSKSSRSPPRRTSNELGARRAVGALADVPRKTTSRSMARDRSVEPSPAWPLGQHEQLTGTDRGAPQSVRVLDLPDGAARVATVVLRRDRPERVVGLDAVHLLAC